MHPQTRHHHFWTHRQPQEGSMAMKDVFGTQGMTLEFPSTICVGWRSLGITAKTFPKMNMLLILDHSVPNTEQVGTISQPFFFFTGLNTASGWCQAPTVSQVSPSLAKRLKENKALDPVPCTSIQGPQIISSSKL